MKPLRLLALAMALASVATVAPADINRIVLQVNDHIATLHDYQMRYGERLRALQNANMSEEERARILSALGESVFREMFDELLLLSKASHERIDVTEEMVDSTVQQMREANGLNDSEAFDAALASTGMTRSMLRDQARRSLLLRQTTAQELRSRVDLNEEDLRRYYQSHLEEFQVPRKVQLRSVVVLEASALSDAERQALAEEIRVLMASEDDALEAAIATRSEAGETTGIIDLGLVQSGDLDPQIESAVWELPVGETSEPTAARGGLHVSQVLAVEEARIRPFVEVKDEVEQLELSRLHQDAVTRMLADLEESSFIRIDPPPEAAGFRTTRAAVDAPLGEFPPATETGAEEAMEEPAADATGDDG